MSGFCLCPDYDPDCIASVYEQRIVKARKTHGCIECGGEILPSEKYELVRGKWEHGWETLRTCPACLEVRKRFFSCFVHSMIWGELEAEVLEEDGDLSLADLDGLSPKAVAMLDERLRLGESEQQNAGSA